MATPKATETSIVTTRDGQLRVWWIPQVPGKMFEVLVPSLEMAKLLLNALADYDKFQFEHKIKPDYCNAGGLIVFQDDDWDDWYSEDGADIDGLTMDQCSALDRARGVNA